MFIRQYRQRSIIDVYNKKCKNPLQRSEKFIVYKHTCTVTGKCYVGKGTNCWESRWKNHVKDSKKEKPKLKFHRAIKKYGEEAWIHEILEELDTELFAFASEIYWIDFYRSTDKRYGYNLTHGGDGGRKTEETKLKISESQKGKKHPHKGKKLTEEHKLKISESHIGLKHSEESRRHMSEAQKGKSKSEESRRHMSEAMKGKPSPNKGKKISEETKQKISESKKGDKNPNFGKKRSPETIQKQRETRRRNRELKNVQQKS